MPLDDNTARLITYVFTNKPLSDIFIHYLLENAPTATKENIRNILF